MNRREFVRTTGLCLPLLAATGAAAGANASRLAHATADLALYDPRFPQALKYAFRFSAQSAWRGIDTDASAEWHRTLRPALTHTHLLVVGITPASIPFCLEMLARDHALVCMTQQRIDRDLIHWTMEATRRG